MVEPRSSSIWNTLERYANAGSRSAEGRDARRIALLNAVCAFGAASTTIFIVICLLLDPASYSPLIAALSLFTIVGLITPLFHRFGVVAAATYVWVSVLAADAVFVLIAGSDLSAHYFYLAGVPITVMALGPTKWLRAVFYVAAFVALFLAIEFFAPDRTSLVPLPDWFAALSFIFCVTSAATINFLATLYASHRAETAEDALEAEHRRSERLLSALVPAAIALRLKEKPNETISDAFPSATILFADLVGFTPRVSVLPASKVVSILNRVFSEFDALAEKHGVEKIKTIGDAYMAAAGLPVPQPNHASSMAEMALDMLDVMRGLSSEFGEALSVRIGIDTGPIIAGVIGSRKPFYDVWGDTVNTAARMESRGLAGAIQLTGRAKRAIGRHYIFEHRGIIDVKGKGRMRVYLLKGRRTPTASIQNMLAA